MELERVPASLPGDNFVSVPFNLVVLIALRLTLVRSRLFGCLICCLAIAIHVCSTINQRSVLANATWRDAPATEVVTQSDVYDYLVFGLVRWVASAMCDVFVCKSIVRILSLRAVVATICKKWLVVLPICVAVFLRGWTDFTTLRPITNDWGIYFYFTSAQVMDGARAAFQGV